MEHVTCGAARVCRGCPEATGEKLEALVLRVGGTSAVVFSRACARCVGLTPKQYRERRQSASGAA